MFKIICTSLLIFLLFVGIGETRTPVKTESKRPTVETAVNNVLPKHEHDANCENTTAEPVQIICILDRSGSMASLAEDTIGGYNSFLAKQKENSGAAEVTTVLFDNEYEKIAEGVDLNEIAELTSKEYYARGTTALLDAIGFTINGTLEKMKNNEICPAKRRVLVMIMTDGLENASREYNKKTVKSMIEATTENYKWNYIFMGANIDSAQEASSIGINRKHAMNYNADSEGVAASFNRMSEAADEVRDSGSLR